MEEEWEAEEGYGCRSLWAEEGRPLGYFTTTLSLYINAPGPRHNVTRLCNSTAVVSRSELGFLAAANLSNSASSFQPGERGKKMASTRSLTFLHRNKWRGNTG